MSGVEEGGGEPSSGSTPDKKTPMALATGALMALSTMGCSNCKRFLSLPIHRTIIVRHTQLYLSRNQRQANYTHAPCNIFCASTLSSSQTAESLSNEFTISDNPAAAASRAPRSPVYRDTHAGKRSPFAAE